MALLATLLAVVAYLWFVTSGVTDEMLLRNSGLAMPLVEVSLPVDSFFSWAPLFLFFLHLNVLFQADNLRQKVTLLKARHLGRWDRWYPLLAPTAAGVQPKLTGRTDPLAAFARVVVYGAPVATLLWMEHRFLPYQKPVTTWTHVAVVCLTIAALWFFLAYRPYRHDPVPGGFWWKPLVLAVRHPVATLLGLAFAASSLGMPWVGPWCRLEVRGKLLVAAEPLPALVASLTLQEVPVPKETIYALHSRGLSLAGRSFRNADFSGSQFYRADFRGADLSGALLIGSDLSGANLGPAGAEWWSGQYLPRESRRRRIEELDDRRPGDGNSVVPSQLVGTDLHLARLVGTNLMLARIEKATFDEAVLVGAEMPRVEGTGSSFRDADLRLVEMFEATMDNSRFAGARLSGASLVSTSAIGSDFSGAVLHAVNLSGSKLMLARMRDAQVTASDLSSADLSGADLGFAHLHGSRGFNVQWVRLRGARAADACLCVECDASDASRDLPSAEVAADLRDLQLRYELDPYEPPPFENVDSLPLLDYKQRLADAEAWKATVCEGFVPCLPVVGVGDIRVGLESPTGGEEIDPETVRAFYTRLGEHLREATCVKEDAGKEERQRARAIALALACQRTRAHFDGPRSAVELEISKGVEAAISKSEPEDLCTALRDALDIVGRSDSQGLCK